VLLLSSAVEYSVIGGNMSVKIKTLFNKRSLVYLSTIFLSVILLIAGNRITTKNLDILSGAEGVNAEKAQVKKVVNIETVEYDLGGETPETGKNIYFTAEILSGVNKGTEVSALQTVDPFTGAALKEVEPGDKIILYQLDNENSDDEWVLGEYLRTDALIIMGIAFLVLLVLLGGFKGFNTIVSLIFTCAAIFAVFIPAVLQGYNIYFWSIITCCFIITMSFLIIYGANKKSLSAGIGCLAGILVSGFLTLIMDRVLKLTGLVNEESLYVVRVNPTNPIDLKAIIFAAILIGAIGAIMDVSMSIAASLAELKDKLEYTPFSLIIKSGISIGRDIMGTMANTLILAYIGSSLSVVLLLVSYNSSILELMNKEMIVVEILQSLVGSFGILVTIPITSMVCAYLFSERVNTGSRKYRISRDDSFSEEYTDGWN